MRRYSLIGVHMYILAMHKHVPKPKQTVNQDHFAGPINPDSGMGLNGMPLASAVFCHTLLGVKSENTSLIARLDRKPTCFPTS